MRSVEAKLGNHAVSSWQGALSYMTWTIIQPLYTWQIFTWYTLHVYVYDKTHARSFPYINVSETRIFQCDAYALRECNAVMLAVLCRCFGADYLSTFQGSGIFHELNELIGWP